MEGILGCPAWVWTWLLAATIWVACKAAVLAWAWPAPRGRVLRTAAWTLLWPGMDARRALAATETPPAPATRDWLLAGAQAVAGLALITAGAAADSPAWAVCAGLPGVLLLLHFGIFRLLAVAHRAAGVPVTPLMDRPLLAASLADFWGRRWNASFHDLMRAFVHDPVARWHGRAAGVLAAFLVSGVLHEMVITLPAGGGHGLPTLYFLVQGLALLLERSAVGRGLGLGRGLRGRAFTLGVVLAPVGLLVPAAFRDRVAVPMIDALGTPLAEAAADGRLAALALWLVAVAHACVLAAGVQVPWRLRWPEELARLSPFNRRIVWVYHGFLGFVIVSFGALAALLHDEMLRGDRAALAVAAFIGSFWTVRLLVDLVVYRDADWPQGRLMGLGHALLVVAFVGMAGTCLGLVGWHVVT